MKKFFVLLCIVSSVLQADVNKETIRHKVGSYFIHGLATGNIWLLKGCTRFPHTPGCSLILHRNERFIRSNDIESILRNCKNDDPSIRKNVKLCTTFEKYYQQWLEACKAHPEEI